MYDNLDFKRIRTEENDAFLQLAVVHYDIQFPTILLRKKEPRMR